MLRLLTGLLALAFCGILALPMMGLKKMWEPTHHYWYGGADSASAIQIFNSNVAATVAPGDIIHLKGNYTLIQLRNLNGSPGLPIEIVVDSGMRVGIRTSNAYGMLLEGNWYRFTGDSINTRIWNHTRIMSSAIIVGSSRNWELNGFRAQFCQSGVLGNPETGGDMGFGIIRNFYIGNTDTTTSGPTNLTSEATYNGPTNRGDTTQVFWQNGIIENGRMENLAGDGVQVALWRNTLMRNLRIEGYGTKNFLNQRSGIVVGGSASATIENVTIDGRGAGGSYLQIFGYGHMVIRNCRFINGALQTNSGDSGGPDGIYLQRIGNASQPFTVRIENTIINGAVRNAIRNVNASSVQLCNVTMSSTAALTNGSGFSTVTGCTGRPGRAANSRGRVNNSQIKSTEQ